MIWATKPSLYWQFTEEALPSRVLAKLVNFGVSLVVTTLSIKLLDSVVVYHRSLTVKYLVNEETSSRGTQVHNVSEHRHALAAGIQTGSRSLVVKKEY